MIYRDGKDGALYAKRFQVTGFTRNRIYDLTKGTKGSRVHHFSVHEDETSSSASKLRVYLKPAPRLRNLEFDFDFREIAIKGRDSNGNIVTKHEIDRVVRAPK
jgi:topoisomerase-4 subunit A